MIRDASKNIKMLLVCAALEESRNEIGKMKRQESDKSNQEYFISKLFKFLSKIPASQVLGNSTPCPTQGGASDEPQRIAGRTVGVGNCH